MLAIVWVCVQPRGLGAAVPAPSKWARNPFVLRVTLLGQGVGLGDPQGSLPTPAMLGLCDSVIPSWSERWENQNPPDVSGTSAVAALPPFPVNRLFVSVSTKAATRRGELRLPSPTPRLRAKRLHPAKCLQ